MEFSSLSLSPSNERILIEVYSIVCPISLTIEEKETEWGHRGLTEILTDWQRTHANEFFCPPLQTSLLNLVHEWNTRSSSMIDPCRTAAKS